MRAATIALVFLLVAVCFAQVQRTPPQLLKSFQADVVTEIDGRKSEGRMYYDYAKQLVRLDVNSFLSTFRTYSFHNQRIQYQVDPKTKKCEKKSLETELFPFFIPSQSLSTFVGETVIDGLKCEQWRIDWFGTASIDIFATNAEIDGKPVSMLKRVIYKTMNFRSVRTDFPNLPTALQPSDFDISGFQGCNPPPPPVTFIVKGFLKNAVNNKLINEQIASIIFKNLRTGKETTATWDGSKGVFEAGNLEAGDYRVSASANGHISTSIRSLSVSGSIPQGAIADIFMSPKLSAGTWRAVLSWDVTPRDLDLHMGTPDNCHVYFKSKSCALLAQLDNDAVKGYGPETITFTPTRDGQYYLYVHNYSNEAPFFNSKASVKLYNDKGLVEDVIVPTSGYDGKNTIWRVLTVDVTNGIPKINILNTVNVAKTY